MIYTLAWVIVLFILLSVTIILTLPNTHLVAVYYYIGSTKIQLATLLLVTLYLGLFLGLLLTGTWVWRLQRRNRKLQQLQRQTAREMQALLKHQGAP
ncbi:MAG: hypothetical protein BWK79_11450 [Beggiatoa sp. IS2]|nr:MAG: hypothetical protein BWK79_11450 [Beggiatoa sp. IS2]